MFKYAVNRVFNQATTRGYRAVKSGIKRAIPMVVG